MRAELGLAAFAVILMLANHAHAQSALNFRVPLSGDEEVPPVETQTTGTALLHVNRQRTEIRYQLDIRQADAILAVAGAHLHCAPAGQNGPVFAFLAGVISGGLDGRVRIEATLTDNNITDDLCGTTIEEVVQSMLDGSVYVNVHSAAHPGGEIRGQVD